MDCIAMVSVEPPRAWTAADAAASRARFEARGLRLVREKEENAERLAAKALAKLETLGRDTALEDSERTRKRAIVEAAIERARRRRAAATRSA
jgi:electron transport complex protein RnfB